MIIEELYEVPQYNEFMSTCKDGVGYAWSQIIPNFKYFRPTLLDEEKELLNKISKVDTQQEFQEVFQLFDLNQKKKNLVRINKLNNLLDKVSDRAIERVESHPEEITNKELLDFMNVTSATIEKTTNNLFKENDMVATPIQINQNNIHVGESENNKLTRESRERIFSVVNQILGKSMNNDVIEIDATSKEGNNDKE